MPHNTTLLAFVVLAIAAPACKGDEPSNAPGADESVTSVEPTVEEKRPESADRPVMIVFSRDYCPPCQIMKPWVTEIAAENPNVDVVTLNVDRKKYEHFGSFFKVTAVPSLVFLEKDGRVVRRSGGLAKKEQMTQTLQELGWAR
jgi:thiol-disulfide isomerase/thioredoxin